MKAWTLPYQDFAHFQDKEADVPCRGLAPGRHAGLGLVSLILLVINHDDGYKPMGMLWRGRGAWLRSSTPPPHNLGAVPEPVESSSWWRGPSEPGLTFQSCRGWTWVLAAASLSSSAKLVIAPPVGFGERGVSFWHKVDPCDLSVPDIITCDSDIISEGHFYVLGA